MIRVGTDKRKIHSAELLVNGLIKCMEKKDFTEINVSDLQRASGVSRATFYRLFDNVQDILAYKCQAIALEIPKKYHDLPADRKEDFLSFTLHYWMEEHQFLEAVFKSNRADILQSALLKNSGFLYERFPLNTISEEKMDYLAAASMGVLSSLLITWVKHGKKETSEQLIEIFRGFGEIMPVMLC